MGRFATRCQAQAMTECDDRVTDAAFACLDCKACTLCNHEYYMVLDETWDEVVPEREGMLCVGCIERRLKRTLCHTDFTDAPLNHDGVIPKSKRLYDRLHAVYSYDL